MKIYIALRKLILVLLLFGVNACTDFEDTNVDPINPTSMDPVKQFVNVQMRFNGNRTVYLRSGAGIIYPLLQQISGTNTNSSGARYAYSESVFSAIWTADFPGVIVNIVDAVEQSRDKPEMSNLHAMARILKVMAFSRLSDLYGDMPYSEAAQGYITLTVRPNYDTQESIYDDFFKELKSAYESLDASKDQVTQDQYFNGDVEKWKKLANSLRLRYAMRLVKVNPEKARQEAEQAIADGVMESNDDVCLIRYENIQSSGVENRGNGLSAGLNAALYRVNSTFLSFMIPDNETAPVDPRLFGYTRNYFPEPTGSGTNMYARPDITEEVMEYYASQPGNGPYAGVIGLPPGTTNYANEPALDNITINVPNIGEREIAQQHQRRQVANYLIYQDAPVLLVTYSEVSLLQAEAKVRGWNAGPYSAETYYQNGIKASIEQLDFFPGSPEFVGVDEFVESQTLETGNELRDINTQLYLSLFMNPHEGFANWRRSGYPELAPVGPTDLPIPRRFQYPLNEIDQNNENVSEAIGRITGVDGSGKDSFLNRVWWDKELE